MWEDNTRYCREFTLCWHEFNILICTLSSTPACYIIHNSPDLSCSSWYESGTPHVCIKFLNWNVIVISSFCYRVNEDLGPLWCYTALIGSWLPTFQDDLLVLSSRVKQYKKTYWSFWPLKKAPIGCLETLVTYCQSVLYTSQNSKDPRLLSCNYESCMFTVSKTVV